jgi:hypothetical protein
MAQAEEARAGYGTAGDHWGVAASSLIRAQGADHVSFALVRLGSNALARGDTGQAEELCRRALAMAEAASTSRLAAHARAARPRPRGGRRRGHRRDAV